jgi:hypothetical protein
MTKKRSKKLDKLTMTKKELDLAHLPDHIPYLTLREKRPMRKGHFVDTVGLSTTNEKDFFEFLVLNRTVWDEYLDKARYEQKHENPTRYSSTATAYFLRHHKPHLIVYDKDGQVSRGNFKIPARITSRMSRCMAIARPSEFANYFIRCGLDEFCIMDSWQDQFVRWTQELAGILYEEDWRALAIFYNTKIETLPRSLYDLVERKDPWAKYEEVEDEEAAG